MRIKATDMAALLDQVQGMSRENLLTGWFSHVDFETSRLLHAFPQLRPAQAEFAQARFYLHPGRLTVEAWWRMKQAAGDLADAFRALGDISIPLCDRPTDEGKACRYALLSNGACPMAKRWH